MREHIQSFNENERLNFGLILCLFVTSLRSLFFVLPHVFLFIPFVCLNSSHTFEMAYHSFDQWNDKWLWSSTAKYVRICHAIFLLSVQWSAAALTLFIWFFLFFARCELWFISWFFSLSNVSLPKRISFATIMYHTLSMAIWQIERMEIKVDGSPNKDIFQVRIEHSHWAHFCQWQ